MDLSVATYDQLYETAIRLQRTLKMLIIAGFLPPEKVNKAWELVQ